MKKNITLIKATSTQSELAMKLSALKGKIKVKESLMAPESGAIKFPAVPSIGMKVVRPVLFFNTGRKRVLDLTFKGTEGNGSIVRISPEINKFWTVERIAENTDRGIVVFVNEYIPINWVYIEIVKVSANGKSAVGKVHTGGLEDLFALYQFPE